MPEWDSGFLSLPCTIDPLPACFLCPLGWSSSSPPVSLHPTLSYPPPNLPAAGPVCFPRSVLPELPEGGCTGGFVCQLSTLTATSSTATALAFRCGEGELGRQNKQTKSSVPTSTPPRDLNISQRSHHLREPIQFFLSYRDQSSTEKSSGPSPPPS